LFFDGLFFTIAVTIIASVGGIILGVCLTMMRISHNKFISLSASAYVNVVRSVPLILVLFWFFFFVPYFIGWTIGSNGPVKIDVFLTIIITFILFESAYYCEIFRSGVKAIPKSQLEAAMSLGLNKFQSFRFVILPQVFRNTLPMLITQLVIVFQDTSVVYVISATDFLGAVTTIARQEHRLVELYLFAAVIYFVISFTLSSYAKSIQNKRIAHMLK
jgi:glutamate/aspartate transport system permease protein